MKPQILKPSLLARIRVAASVDEIGQLLQEGGGFGKAKGVTIKRWRQAAKRRAIELRAVPYRSR